MSKKKAKNDGLIKILSGQKASKKPKIKTYWVAHFSEVVLVEGTTPEDAAVEAQAVMDQEWFEEGPVVMFDKKPVWIEFEKETKTKLKVKSVDKLVDLDEIIEETC